ncbi:hypothetical protein U9M48_042948 [Paspalum notatum var. saurae]|uniref:Uncharacterized protein n=1 Tax=Paspalum notatum var. saurae TaxID=547442 RepID=A0AAQ3XFY0_PASNO
MAGYHSSFTMYWMLEEEEDDDDIFHLADDDEAKVATYNHLVQCENSQRRRRSDAPPKEIRLRNQLDDEGHKRIWADYFADHPMYNDKQFRERFFMRRHLVLRIVDAVEAHNPSNNDINVLQKSPVFSSYLNSQSTPVEFEVNSRTYNMGYYLADGIYPEWPAFVKSIRHPMEKKTQHFSRRQESARKDIERAFGVLRARFAPVRGPVYGWYPK